MKTVYPNVFRHEDLRKDSEAEQERKIEALLSAMTTEEKYSLLGGGREPEDKGKIGNAGYVPGIPRLGIPELVMYDGPAGITGIVETTGVPTPTLLGCTWDDDMAYAFGQVAASECSVCSGNVLLAPQVDVIRSPHFFRNKDMKSEDSYQAARMGSAETRGVLDAGVIPTLKHFAAANLFGIKFFEFPKQYVDEQTIHEVYYRPFETALRENGSAAVMNAYNNVNGEYCSANAEMLKGVLRDQWGFKGAVMSDWGSVHSFTLDKGMDMEMPFPAFNAPKMIEKRFSWGRMTMETVDTAVRHVLYTMASVGLLSLVRLDENGQVIPDPEHTHPIEMEWRYERAVSEGLLDQNAETAAQIVREGAVLLKNDGALPLQAGNGKTVLIGLGAKYPICGEAQERSFGRLERMRSGQEAFRDITGVELPAYAGIDYAGEPIPAEACFRDAACTEPGLTRTWGILEEDRNLLKTRKGPGGGGDAFTGTVLKDEDGEIVDTGLSTYNAKKEQADPEHPAGSFCRVDAQVCFVCGTDEAGQPVKHYRNGANGNAFSHEESFTWKGYLKAPETGEYSLILECVGGQATFLIQTEDGWIQAGQSRMREWAQWPWEMIINSPEGMGITSRRIALQAGKAYPIVVYARHCVRNKDLQLRLNWETPSFREKTRKAAVQAAAEADSIVYFACDTDSQATSGGFHRAVSTLEINAEQTALLQEVLAAKKESAKITVILQTGNARAIGSWADRADAIVTAFMPGQEGGRVLVELLTGKTNFTGKLNQSIPRVTEDTPLTDTPEHKAERNDGIPEGEDTVIRLSEGIYTGYRWHDKAGVPALFPFGHGLSYTTYEYSDLEIDGDTVRLKVTNTGDRAGDEIVQLYLGKAKVPERIQMAEKQLAGYVRLKNLQPGETREAVLKIAPEMLSCWDPEAPLRTRPDGTKDKWVKPTGERKVYIGASSADIRLEGSITVLNKL